MITTRHRALIACAPIALICAGFGLFAASAIESTSPGEHLDNTLLACLPALIVGIVAAHVGHFTASLIKGHNRGLALIEIERAIRSYAWMALIVVAVWSRPAALIAGSVAWGAFYAVRGMASEERWRLNNLFHARDSD